MEQIQRDFSHLLWSAISLCFLVLYLVLQLISLFCRKVTAEYCCPPGAFSCTCAIILSAPVPWGISWDERGCWVSGALGMEGIAVLLCLSGHSSAGLSPTSCALVMIWGCDCLQTHEYLIWKEGRTAAKGRMGCAQANSIFSCWFCHFLT